MSLSINQQNLIISTWRKLDFDWLFEIGAEIYWEIFRLEPSVKHIFPYVVQYESENKDVKTSKQFRAQALRFVQVLGQAVANLSENDPNDQEFVEILFQLGHRHRSLVSQGFKPEFWDIFETAVVNVMEREYTNNKEKYCFTDDQKKVAVDGWKTVAQFIIIGMKKGFNNDYYPEVGVSLKNNLK